jgi:hypothetical protein
LPVMLFFLSISNVKAHFRYWAGTSSVVTALVPR